MGNDRYGRKLDAVSHPSTLDVLRSGVDALLKKFLRSPPYPSSSCYSCRLSPSMKSLFMVQACPQCFRSCHYWCRIPDVMGSVLEPLHWTTCISVVLFGRRRAGGISSILPRGGRPIGNGGRSGATRSFSKANQTCIPLVAHSSTADPIILIFTHLI